MPVQMQNSSFAKRYAQRAVTANEAVKGKPPEVARKELPPGISGIAKLSSMYTKEQTGEGKKCPKGEVFFRASAIAITPEEYAGGITSIIIELCDLPAKGEREGKTYEQQYDAFRSLIQVIGNIPDCPAKDAAGIDAYWNSAMKALTDPQNPPIYVYYKTRGWTPPKNAQNPNPKEIILHDWTGRAPAPPKPDPAGGVTTPSQPPPSNTPPPTSNGQTSPTPTLAVQPDVVADLAGVVAGLVEMAMADPNGDTVEGKAACHRLEELAWSAGWSEEQTTEPPPPFTQDWCGVGDMALNPPKPAEPAVSPATPGLPKVGSHWNYRKRMKSGDLLTVNGKPVDPAEVEITAVTADYCLARWVKDGKGVVDVRSKKQVEIKFAWLEPLTPPY